MKRSAADIAFSKCVRERSEWTCEYCKRNFEHNKGGLHCSHVFGRAARSVRFDADNAMAHCNGCHRKLEQHPLEFTAHYKEVRGEGIHDILLEKWRNVKRKITKLEEKDIAKHYQEQLKIMEKKRKDGVTGWLEFINYE